MDGWMGQGGRTERHKWSVLRVATSSSDSGTTQRLKKQASRQRHGSREWAISGLDQTAAMQLRVGGSMG
jgi:hypothetical protein